MTPSLVECTLTGYSPTSAIYSHHSAHRATRAAENPIIDVNLCNIACGGKVFRRQSQTAETQVNQSSGKHSSHHVRRKYFSAPISAGGKSCHSVRPPCSISSENHSCHHVRRKHSPSAVPAGGKSVTQFDRHSMLGGNISPRQSQPAESEVIQFYHRRLYIRRNIVLITLGGNISLRKVISFGFTV